MSEEDGGQTQCANHGEEATSLSTAWCHADWRRSGALGWRKPKPAADKLLSPLGSQRPISAADCTKPSCFVLLSF